MIESFLSGINCIIDNKIIKPTVTPPAPVSSYITFADPEVERICIENWSSDGIGLTYEDAAAVTDLGSIFTNNTIITTFEELQYFSGLITLKNNAFMFCSNLVSIIIPNSVTSIEDGIPEGLGCFLFCTKLKTIILSNSITSIGLGAFTACTGLGSISLPNSITYIGMYAFAACEGLFSINIPNSVTLIETGVFLRCKALESIIIPNSITSIKHEAFSNCKSLISVNIPNSVTEIGDRAFYGCNELTSVTIKALIPPQINNSTFQDTNLTNIYVPSDSVDAYKAAPIWSDYADVISAIV